MTSPFPTGGPSRLLPHVLFVAIALVTSEVFGALFDAILPWYLARPAIALIGYVAYRVAEYEW